MCPANYSPQGDHLALEAQEPQSSKSRITRREHAHANQESPLEAVRLLLTVAKRAGSESDTPPQQSEVFAIEHKWTRDNRLEGRT